ncbi:MAG: REP-associated tyrosine transposase [Terriglobia bacterium]
MSRLRRPFLYDRYMFVTVKLLPSRRKLEEPDYARLAIALARMRLKNKFALTAWVFLSDHWHAIIYPPHPLSIAQAMSAIKVSSTVAINRGRHEKGELWQERFFDRAQRTVKEYAETIEYIHLNPVKRGLAKRPEDWKWSSFPEYAGVDAAEQQGRCGLTIDRVRLPADQNARI